MYVVKRHWRVTFISMIAISIVFYLFLLSNSKKSTFEAEILKENVKTEEIALIDASILPEAMNIAIAKDPIANEDHFELGSSIENTVNPVPRMPEQESKVLDSTKEAPVSVIGKETRSANENDDGIPQILIKGIGSDLVVALINAGLAVIEIETATGSFIAKSKVGTRFEFSNLTYTPIQQASDLSQLQLSKSTVTKHLPREAIQFGLTQSVGERDINALKIVFSERTASMMLRTQAQALQMFEQKYQVVVDPKHIEIEGCFTKTMGFVATRIAAVSNSHTWDKVVCF